MTRTEATIGKTVSIKGQLYSEEDMYLDGKIEGSISLPQSRVTIGKNGKIQANIEAREVDVYGDVQGNVQARGRITIRSAANLVGDLKCAAVSIEDGAYLKGCIDIPRPVTTESAAKPDPKQTAATPARPTSQAASAANGGAVKA